MTNKKLVHRQGKVQLIDGIRHFGKLEPKSLGTKRNEMSDVHIAGRAIELAAELECIQFWQMHPPAQRMAKLNPAFCRNCAYLPR